MYHIYICVCVCSNIYIYVNIYIYSLFEKLYIYLFIYSIYSIFIYIPILIFRTSLRLASANIWHRRASACAARPLLLSLFPVCIDLVRPSPENGKLLVGPQHLAFGGIAGSVCRSIYRSICLSINFFPFHPSIIWEISSRRSGTRGLASASFSISSAPSAVLLAGSPWEGFFKAQLLLDGCQCETWWHDTTFIWLVVYLPLWKIWVRQLGWWHSQYMEK